MNGPARHPLQVGYLVVGLVFLGIAGAWALRAGGVVDTSQVQWLMPLVLVVAGGVGLVAFAARGMYRGPRDDQPDDQQPEDQPFYQPDTEPTLPIEGEHR